MVTLARRACKTLLFITLFFLSVRYVHTYPIPMPKEQVALLFKLSATLGIRDPEDLYISSMLIIELITTIVVYILIIKAWRRYNNKTKADENL
ncbi:hypothetical protein F6X50_17735 [Dickeya dianthicola]|uniref:hypothetical protein n=1 Tax=Dickeya dianthicola TaxID=204039 RepID=UPI00137041B4|nr:hypothetical protein [Dickeya dianthicola]MCI4237519.1 hypothetical protein [Dickeya dianthicola]MCI4256944.1 hypothetical protein [Dickeya dianthicola]MZG22260.1 hypothetical protein [Dickeya dianthicola]MZI90894.1 hypothetical protein [Dickeya dianthicola]